MPGKTVESICFGEFFLAHDDAAARPAQTFVRGGGDEMRVRNRARMLAARDQPGDVRHVDEKKRADRIGDLAQPREIDDARISRRAGGDHDRAHFLGLFLQARRNRSARSSRSRRNA